MLKKWRRQLTKRLKRRVKRHPFASMAFCAALVLIGGAMVYNRSNQHNGDVETYRPLLQVIAQAESNGNYNAYFGNAGNTSVRFTDMTIQQVLDWQASYVANGSASSAVGRYQFLNTTLEGLVREYAINTDQMFNESMQDNLAALLVERRGGEAYINHQISEQDFAASLAKEWASLPMMVGDQPEKSYYQADGLNKALATPQQILAAVGAVRAK